MPPVLDLLAGAAAGGTAVMATYPLDLVRTRLAFMTEAGTPVRARAAAAFQQQLVAAAHTPAAVLSPATTYSAAAISSSSSGGGGMLPLGYGRFAGTGLTMYSARGCSSGACGSGRGGLSSSAARLAAGLPLPSSSAGSVICAARLQGQTPARALHMLAAGPSPAIHHTIRSVLTETFRAEGVRGIYHGVGASMYGILPYAGLKFFTYQHLKQVGHGRVGSGRVAGACGCR